MKLKDLIDTSQKTYIYQIGSTSYYSDGIPSEYMDKEVVGWELKTSAEQAEIALDEEVFDLEDLVAIVVKLGE